MSSSYLIAIKACQARQGARSAAADGPGLGAEHAAGERELHWRELQGQGCQCCSSTGTSGTASLSQGCSEPGATERSPNSKCLEAGLKLKDLISLTKFHMLNSPGLQILGYQEVNLPLFWSVNNALHRESHSLAALYGQGRSDDDLTPKELSCFALTGACERGRSSREKQPPLLLCCWWRQQVPRTPGHQDTAPFFGGKKRLL